MTSIRSSSRRTPLPFVITAVPRCGSFMLSTALDAHPEVRCCGETLSRWRRDLPLGRSAEEILRAQVYAAERGIRAAGFKLQAADAREGLLGDARGFLRRLEVQAIHLVRRNLLRQLLSFEIAERTGVWILAEGERRPVPVAVALEPKSIRARLRDLERDYAQNSEDFVGCPSITVAYEDLAWGGAVGAGEEMARIFRFLSVEPSAVRPETRRQERRPLRTAIRNFDEVVRALSGTRWERFLAEEDPLGEEGGGEVSRRPG